MFPKIYHVEDNCLGFETRKREIHYTSFFKTSYKMKMFYFHFPHFSDSLCSSFFSLKAN